MINFELDDPSGFIGRNLAKPILQGIYQGTQELRDGMLDYLIDVMPVDRGGLQADAQGTFNSSPDDTTLIQLTTGTENQLAAWGRVYVLYNEGPTNGLGLNSWTIADNSNENGNPLTYRNMFHRTATEHLDYVSAWGVEVVDDGIGILTGGL